MVRKRYEQSEDDEHAVQDPAGNWCVLIEETLGRGEDQRWSLSDVRTFDSRDEALDAAWHSAREDEPDHPAFEKKREIYRVGQDMWVVWLQGATRAYHFRVYVGRPEA